MSSAKTNARKCAVQALYQWQMTGESLSQIKMDFLFAGIDSRLAKELLNSLAKKTLNSNDKVLSITHRELATKLGLVNLELVKLEFVQEVISRHLKQFEEKEWIDLSEGAINLIDEEALKNLIDDEEEYLLEGAQKNYFMKILNEIPKQLIPIDEALAEFVDRPVEKIDPVERAILRISVYELINRLETPYKVIINEGVNLAKCFGADGSHKYVNGVLDKVSQKKRAVEIKAKQGGKTS